MTEENRRDWLTVAWQTLKDIPPHVLTIAAAEARKQCDHPSKIVPAIVAESERYWAKSRPVNSGPEFPQIEGPKPTYCSPEEARKILAEFGLKRNPLATDD